MIILSIITVVSLVCAIYFVIQAGKLSSQLDDKEMVNAALRGQLESDRLTIESLKQRILRLETIEVAAKPVVTSNTSAPRKSRKPKAPKQA